MSESGNEQISLKGSAKAFRDSFGEQVFNLACHAAVPVVLSSDLLHLLRINFFLDLTPSLLYVAESQFLLSPLCNEVGSDLYEISPEIRDSLLSELAANPAYGETRIREIASLLFEYSERFSPWKDNLMIERAQQLTALNFLDPERAKSWLESAEQPLLKTANDREWFIAMRSELRKLDALLSSSRAREVAEIEESAEAADDGPFGLKLLHSFKAHDKPIGRFAWSPDGSQLATPSADKTVKIWDTRTGRLIRTLSGHTERVICVDWSPQGNTIASGSDDQTAKIWDTESGRLIESIGNRSSSVASLAWSPDGNTLALGFNDSTVQLWQNGRLIESRRGLGIVTSLKWSPDGTQLAVASEEETLVQVWNPKTPMITGRTLQHRAQVLALDWSPNGKLLAAGCSDNTVWLWEGISDDKPRRILEGHTNIVNAVSFSSDGRVLASKSHDGTVRLWRTDSGELVSVLPDQGHHFVVAGIAFNPHQPQLATLAERDTVINIWQVDFATLLTQTIEIAEASFATTKIILLGESGVGKTSIANALRTSGRTVSPFDQTTLADLLTLHLPAGVRRETFVWDLGMPDPLLTRIHLYDTDIVLLLFDERNSTDSLDRLEKYWNAATRRYKRGVRSVWVCVSRGTNRDERLTVGLRSRIRNQPRDYWLVDVADKSQSDELIERLKLEISETKLSRQVRLPDFEAVQNHIRTLTQQASTFYIGFNPLRRSLSEDNKFSERQLRQCLWHLDRSKAVRLLRRSSNEEIVWLQPASVDRLISLITERARGNSTDPGRIEERELIEVMYEDRYFGELSREATEILLDCTANLLVDRELCFRIRGERGWLVFPELVPRREPPSVPAHVAHDSPFDHLLAWLNPDREIAGEQYENIRKGLITIFSNRGMPDAEAFADETFDRITKRVDEIAKTYIGEPARYFYGVAMNIYREYARRNLSLPIEPLSESQLYQPYDLDLESKQNCLDTCLEKLSSENRELILAYYTGESRAKIENRTRMASQLKISHNTLRIRAHRIRSQLEKCIRECLAGKANSF